MVQVGLIGNDYIAVWSANRIKIASLKGGEILDFEDESIPFNDDTQILSVASTCTPDVI